MFSNKRESVTLFFIKRISIKHKHGNQSNSHENEDIITLRHYNIGTADFMAKDPSHLDVLVSIWNTMKINLTAWFLYYILKLMDFGQLFI